VSVILRDGGPTTGDGLDRVLHGGCSHNWAIHCTISKRSRMERQFHEGRSGFASYWQRHEGDRPLCRRRLRDTQRAPVRSAAGPCGAAWLRLHCPSPHRLAGCGGPGGAGATLYLVNYPVGVRRDDRGPIGTVLLTRRGLLTRESESFCQRRSGSDRNPRGYDRTPNDLREHPESCPAQRVGVNPCRKRGKTRDAGDGCLRCLALTGVADPARCRSKGSADETLFGTTRRFARERIRLNHCGTVGCGGPERRMPQAGQGRGLSARDPSPSSWGVTSWPPRNSPQGGSHLWRARVSNLMLASPPANADRETSGRAPRAGLASAGQPL
jgi:hypothetical protein